MTAPHVRDVPRFVLCTMTFGDTADEAESAMLLEAATEAGITWVDTANSYSAGLTEEIVGRLLKGRDDVVLASKVGQRHPEVGRESLLAPDRVRRSVEGSLRRLGRDHIELLYLHQPDRTTPVAETLVAVAELVREGKVGALGISNYSAWQSMDLLRTADDVGCPRPVVSQQMYNLLATRLDEEYAEFAHSSGVATIIYNPLAGGLLTGRYRSADDAHTGRFATSGIAAMYRDRYFDERLFAAVARAGQVADEAGMTTVELALRWTLRRPVVDSVLLGGSRVAQLRTNLAALARGPLPVDVQAAADAVAADLRGPMPAYHR